MMELDQPPAATEVEPGRAVTDMSRLTWSERVQSVAAMAGASFRADRRRTITSVVLDLAVGVAGPLMAVGTGALVDAVAVGGRSRLAGAVVLLAGATGLVLGMSLVSDRVRLRLEENVAHHVETQVMEMITALPSIAHHESPTHVHRVRRLLEDSWLIGMAIPAMILTLEILVRFGFTVAVLAAIDSRLVLLPLAIVPLIAAGVVAERIRLRAIDRRMDVMRRVDDLFQVVGDNSRRSEGELRTFGATEHVLQLHGEAGAAIAHDELAHRLRGAWGLALGHAVFAGAFGLGMLAVADRATSGQASVGELVTVIGLTSGIVGQATSVSNRLNWINWAMTGVRHYLWILGYQARHRDRGGSQPSPSRLEHGIRFEDVTFRYPGTSRNVLEGLDLELPAGSVVAVVGDNGAGKTTLIKLLQRYYEPTGGQITVDGVPLSEIDVREWRARVTAALQDHTRPEVLIGEAVGMGDVSRLDDLEAREQAASRSGADAVVAVVPGGWEAQLGLEWPGGTDLSGGEWQRLAVGRSAMRTDPLLLILDEPTAALDPVAEHALFEHYTGADGDERRSRGAVTVVISHRLSTVRMADRIVVLDGARISEHGTHEELLAADGHYAELFRLQSAAYR